MNDLAFWSSFATIVGAPISILGLLFAYFSLREKHKKTTQDINKLSQNIQQINTRFETLSEIVNLHNKYSSSGDQYHNCTITNVPSGPEQLSEQYAEGEGANA